MEKIVGWGRYELRASYTKAITAQQLRN